MDDHSIRMEGALAYAEGERQKDCPYHRGDVYHSLWLEGWRSVAT